MKIRTELLPGTWLIQLNRLQDARGAFVKTFSRTALDGLLPGQGFDLCEEFYSVSKRNVIRGMHFQLASHDHCKLVYCAAGAVLDVLLDLPARVGYGHHVSVRLEADSLHLLWIPKGIAHGFLSLTDDSLMIYKTSSEHVPTHDAGVRWDSFGFDLQCAAPILSDRDIRHGAFSQLSSPF